MDLKPSSFILDASQQEPLQPKVWGQKRWISSTTLSFCWFYHLKPLAPKTTGFYGEDLILKAKTHPNNDQKPKAERGIFPHSQTMLDFKLISSHPWWVKICEICCFTKLQKPWNFREFIVDIWVFVMTSDRRVMLPYIKDPSSKSAPVFPHKDTSQQCY